MTTQELERLRFLASSLPDGELRDLIMLAIGHIKADRATLIALGDAIKEASK